MQSFVVILVLFTYVSFCDDFDDSVDPSLILIGDDGKLYTYSLDDEHVISEFLPYFNKNYFVRDVTFSPGGNPVICYYTNDGTNDITRISRFDLYGQETEVFVSALREHLSCESLLLVYNGNETNSLEGGVLYTLASSHTKSWRVEFDETFGIYRIELPTSFDTIPETQSGTTIGSFCESGVSEMTPFAFKQYLDDNDESYGEYSLFFGCGEHVMKYTTGSDVFDDYASHFEFSGYDLIQIGFISYDNNLLLLAEKTIDDEVVEYFLVNDLEESTIDSYTIDNYCDMMSCNSNGDIICYSRDEKKFYILDKTNFDVKDTWYLPDSFEGDNIKSFKLIITLDDIALRCEFDGTCPYLGTPSDPDPVDPSVVYFPGWGIALIVIGAIFGSIILVIIIVIPILIIVFAQRRELQRFGKYKEELKFLELESATPGAKIKVNPKMFEIDFDQIKMIKVIGKGGFGQIYKAEWNNQDVALKLFKVTDLTDQVVYDDFEKEVSIFSSISHPNIIRFYGATLKDPRIGIVMDLCEKGDLLTYMQSDEYYENRWSILAKLEVLLGVCAGMQYLHDRKIIHRDLKTNNVLLDNDFLPKLIDFGLSKIIGKTEVSQRMTKKVGTSWYMAPEVFNNEDYSIKVDIFSFSIVMFEVLTENFRPYGKDVFNVESIVAKDPNFRPKFDDTKFPKWIKDLIVKNWSADPDERNTFKEIIKKISENNSGRRSERPKRVTRPIKIQKAPSSTIPKRKAEFYQPRKIEM